MSETPATDPLEGACRSVVEAWQGALPPASGAVGGARSMSDDGLVRTIESLAGLSRQVGALFAECAAELDERSNLAPEFDVARRHGFSSAERLIAQATGDRYADAARLVAVGRAIRERMAFSGEALPARYPVLAAAVGGGHVGIASAETIRRFLDRIAVRADPIDLEAAEALLVERAPQVTCDGLPRLIKQLEAYLDPDGVKPREDELRAQRRLRVWEDAHGMIRIDGALDPASGAYLKTAVEALVSRDLRDARGRNVPTHDGDGDEAGDTVGATAAGDAGSGLDAPDGAGGVDPLFIEDRTIAQLNADALVDLARHALGCGDAPTALRAAMVITRVDAVDLADDLKRAAALADGLPRDFPRDFAGDLADDGAESRAGAVHGQSRRTDDPIVPPPLFFGTPGGSDGPGSRVGASRGFGYATIDGIDQPVGVPTAREFALAAGIAPLFLGDDSVKLDFGQTKRLFTLEQKLVLAERDGGCAWPGCARSASYCEAHHILWWERDDGETDLRNGIMLCAHHHHRVHNDGWLVFVNHEGSWFVPPAHLDPGRRPRAGNRGTGHLVKHHLARARSRRAATSKAATASLIANQTAGA